ncbi:hypothetical protein SH661x_003153 [Planctomicrobium sp. SH661]|uniref:hypothetical protein n=1 Tax=Planctomicrobium sp. SH661 TaxID=3448124 RepID=UPI003F5C9286
MFSAVLGISFAIAWNSVALAILPQNVEFVTPRCGQQGSTVEVTLEGVYLSDPREVIFYRPGIKAIEVEQLENPPSSRNLGHGGRVEERVRCKFVIAPDCPVGEHPFRLRTGTQLSTISVFWVTPLPIVNEVDGENDKEPRNDTLETATPVQMESTAYGRIFVPHADNQKDIDIYRVTGKAGDPLAVEVVCVRLGDKTFAQSEFDLKVRILDDAGKVVAENDDSPQYLQDPVVSTVLPRDGDYFIEIRQSVYKPDYHQRVYYLAHISAKRRPQAAYPAGGPAGQPLKTTFLGDARGPYEAVVNLPAKEGKFEFIDGLVTPLELRVSNFPNVLEDRSGKETRVPQLPAALNGIIEKPGENDKFRLQVKQGETYRIRVYARSIGSPLDPQISLRPVDADAVELDADDGTLEERDLFWLQRGVRLKDYLDPSKLWSPKKDGDYILQISDARSLGSPLSIYRIEVEPVRDGVHTYLYSTAHHGVQCPRDTHLVIQPGNRWTLNFMLAPIQGNQYTGDIEFEAVGLPPGVKMISSRVPATAKSAPLQFIAEPGTEPQAANVEINVRPVGKTNQWETGSHQSCVFINHPGGAAYHVTSVNSYVLAVTDPAPYEIEVIPPAIALPKNGELSIQVRVKRQPNCNNPVDLQFGSLPDGVRTGTAVTVPPGQTEATLNLSCAPTAKVGITPMAVIATMAPTEGSPGLITESSYLGIGHIRTSSQVFDLQVAEQYFDLKSQPASVRRGQQTDIVWDLEHKRDFPGEAEVKLTGLPKGVTMVGSPPRIKSGDSQLVFTVAATDEALLGQYKELGCDIQIHDGDQTTRLLIGKGILRVDPALTSDAGGVSR